MRRRERVDSHVLRRYEIGSVIRQVEDGIVWKGVDKKTMQTVALKKIFNGFLTFTDAQRTYREVMLLLTFRHDNIIRLLNVVRAVNHFDLYLVFENLLDTDLHALIRANFLEGKHKVYIIYQLVKVLKFLHSANVIHRDLRPSNMLLNADCRMKLTNFRLARLVDSESQLSEEEPKSLKEDVVERWYRAPEIVLGGKQLTKAVDMWSVGCILAELLTGRPIFPGESMTDQISCFIQLLGPPTTDQIDSFHSDDDAYVLLSSTVSKPRKTLGDLVPQANNPKSPHLASFLEKLFVYTPEERMTAEQALRHPYLARFHDEASETAASGVPINVAFNVASSVEMYRTQLFHHVSRRRTHRLAGIQERLRRCRDSRRAKYGPRRNEGD